MIDFASAEQDLVKVRVRIDQIHYLDYLCFHYVESTWRVTAKCFTSNAALYESGKGYPGRS